MKKNIVYITTAALLAAIHATPSKAEQAGDAYVGVRTEAVFDGNSEIEGFGSKGTLEYDTAAGIGGTLGYYIMDQFHVEADISWRRRDIDRVSIRGITFNSGETTSLDTMFNAIYDINTGTQVTPYLGAGIGFSYLTDDDEAAFAYQGLAGVSYPISENSTLYGGYRYFQTENFDFGPNETVRINSHIAEIGIRFTW